MGGNKQQIKRLNFLSTNSVGLKNKINSLKSELNKTQSAIFTIQETHARAKGKLKVDEFEIFKSIRDKGGGGSIIGVNSE